MKKKDKTTARSRRRRKKHGIESIVEFVLVLPRKCAKAGEIEDDKDNQNARVSELRAQKEWHIMHATHQ